MGKDSFLAIVTHEIGHSGSWASNLYLTSAERIDMLSEVYGRSIARDRYTSPYLKSITPDTLHNYFKDKIEGDKEKAQYLRYVQANEYWAEIHQAYSLDKTGFKQKYPEDYRLVNKWIKKTMK